MANNLILTTKNGGKVKAKNVSFINPAAADSDCVKAAVALNSLTQNELVSVERVVKSALELPSAAKQSPNLTLNPSSLKQDTANNFSFTVSRLGTGAITTTNTGGATCTVNGTTINVSNVPQSNFTITVTVAVTDEYEAASADFTFEYTGTTSTDIA